MSYDRCWYLQDIHNMGKMIQKQLRIYVQHDGLFALKIQHSLLQRNVMLLKVGTQS